MSDNKADIFGLDGIRMLLQLMKENDVSELSLEQGDSRMKLLRGGVVQAPAAPVQTAAPAHAPEAA
ncbi:MAG: acetyl-CoA carboxylase, biotin carboxyl carrier protein, partial [Thermoguttaceae bacterium]|nr:acetyl-CoA carboxylase, biotin carboxyl carrier protein [Thermoguttaceae bacterium]